MSESANLVNALDNERGAEEKSETGVSPEADALSVSEIFESVQGEGVNIGTPSMFLRLAFCNLRCSWCDTKYTWDWQTYRREDEVETMSSQAVISLLRSRQPKNIVITGGEPLLQQRQLLPVIRDLAADHTFEVETAGTITPSNDLEGLINIWNVSPKLANSNNSFKARHRAEPLMRFAQMENAFFKFVIQAEGDIQEVLELVNEFHIPNTRVLLMPEGIDAVELQKKSGWLAQQCIQHGFRLGYRLHVALWGNKRGV
ncbi:MAG TPA: 7-carboxy-7-deazaguanine synthase QueE [Candidatus Angelobacter sp.]|nr:7-carboxy-7-deazaguanine synthase QueE [Candidatus Angelobacter sp.]